MKMGHIVHYVEDVAKTVAFYEAAFELTMRRNLGNYAEMETGLIVLAFSQEKLMSEDYPFFRASRPGQPPCAAEITFLAKDSDELIAAHDRALKAGAVNHVTPHQKDWGQWMSHLRDINGNLVEICTPHS